MRVRLSHKLLCLLLPICLACCFVQACTAQTNAPVIVVDHGPNSAQQIGKHYVVLVSLDGFRYDYPKLYDAKNILELASTGASAPEGMIPSFPSVTFPNTTRLSRDFTPNITASLRTRFTIQAAIKPMR